ncbi:hypothetical protein PG993_008248 [Apiospora rasikravindrae]|uniref:Uncharacterized protein n=1 Tax=Apiospora rasikravindrae TaxID=990691 RepID=A0ABR1SZS3_9PEZI
MDLSSELYEQAKGFCEGLEEEKMSFLLVTCARKNPDAPADHERLPGAGRLVPGSAAVEESENLRLVDLGSQLETEIGGLEKLYGMQNSMLRVLLSRLVSRVTRI